jgi:hypothetical protein
VKNPTVCVVVYSRPDEHADRISSEIQDRYSISCLYSYNGVHCTAVHVYTCTRTRTEVPSKVLSYESTFESTRTKVQIVRKYVYSTVGPTFKVQYVYSSPKLKQLLLPYGSISCFLRHFMTWLACYVLGTVLYHRVTHHL